VDAPDDRSFARAPRVADLARICRALNAAGARYMLIGGFAVIAHGAGRTTQDIDLLVDDSPDNVARVTEALGVLEDHAAREVRPDDLKNYTVVRVADEVVVDIMSRACGVTYADAIADADTFQIQGVDVPVASKRTLIRMKDTARPTDRADREYLQARLQEEDREGT
jgi:Nucleotidyl transferase of unknown function (DUF2204)